MIKKGDLYYPTDDFKNKAVVNKNSIYKEAEKDPVKFWVKKTIQDYDEMITSFRSRKLRRKSFDDKILEVITRREGNKIIIITAYYLKGEI